MKTFITTTVFLFTAALADANTLPPTPDAPVQTEVSGL